MSTNSRPRAPSDFRYWLNAARPSARAARALSRRVLGVDAAPPDNVVTEFAAGYFEGDPLADALVAAATSPKAARAALERAVGRASTEDAADQAATALLAELDEPPSWLDPVLLERGAGVFRRYGSSIFRFAGAITLFGYSESSVAKPLALTGAYTGSTARRRFLETVAFWIAVSEPGGMSRGAEGFRTALRVRVLHAEIRRRLLAHPEWRLEDWGVPINQSDALLTLLGGSFIPGVAMHVLGYRVSRADIEASMHFWRYVGHVMGVRPASFPTTFADAAQLVFVALLKRAGGAGEDGVKLCRDYARAFRPDESTSASAWERLRARLDHHMHLGMTRLFLPAHTYAQNGLPEAGLWALAPMLRFPVNALSSIAAGRSERARELADRLARKERAAWYARRSNQTARFEPVEQMSR